MKRNIRGLLPRIFFELCCSFLIAARNTHALFTNTEAL